MTDHEASVSSTLIEASFIPASAILKSFRLLENCCREIKHASIAGTIDLSTDKV